MSARVFFRICQRHRLPCKRDIVGRLYVLAQWRYPDGRTGADWVECTGWSLTDLRDWMGY